MKSIYIISLLLLTVSSVTAQKKGLVYTYIERNAERAIRTMDSSGIPASIIMAIALEESSAGRSEVATNANNHFGMKAGLSWKKAIYRSKAGNKFRKYADVQESYDDFAGLIERGYSAMLQIDKKDYKKWAKAFAHSGYCRRKGYDRRLIYIIETHLLYNLDKCILEFK
jgi:flagellum-specific peptidoglycan hydrolase FlgJ